MKCPHCHEHIDNSECAASMGRVGGAAKSEAKIQASKVNGRLGGRPIKNCKSCGNPSLKIIKKMPRIWYYECSDCGNEQFTKKF